MDTNYWKLLSTNYFPNRSFGAVRLKYLELNNGNKSKINNNNNNRKSLSWTPNEENKLISLTLNKKRNEIPK